MTMTFWTPERLGVLLSILSKGGTYMDVAKAVGCAKGSVASKVSRLRVARDERLPDRLRISDARYRRNMLGKRGPSLNPPSIPIALRPAPIAPRDPCFRCGVRRDVGCVHTAHERLAA